MRNTIRIGAVNIKFYENNKAVSTVSDIFLWRTDNGFKTKFKFSDILKMFYEVEGSLGWKFISIQRIINSIKIKKLTHLIM